MGAAAAALGLAAALVSTPVRAPEAAPAPTPAAAPAATAESSSSSSVATFKRKKKANRPKVAKEPEVKKEESEGFKLPSFSAPEAKPSPLKKVIISPADELDDDEKSLNAPNLPLLAALFFGPSFVYIAFYVLGS